MSTTSPSDLKELPGKQIVPVIGTAPPPEIPSGAVAVEVLGGLSTKDAQVDPSARAPIVASPVPATDTAMSTEMPSSGTDVEAVPEPPTMIAQEDVANAPTDAPSATTAELPVLDRIYVIWSAMMSSSTLFGTPKELWSIVSKFLVSMWLQILHAIVYATSRTEAWSKSLKLKASKQVTQTQSKLKKWHKDPKRQIRNAGGLIKRFEGGDVQPCTNAIRIASNLEVLSTWEWKDTSTEKDEQSNFLEPPVIYVPGFGRRFRKPELPHKVMRDTGMSWMDQHVYRRFEQQFEPLFQSLSVMNPDVRFNDVDVVIGRSNLLVLLNWVQGRPIQPVTFELKMVKKTLFVHAKGGGRVAVQGETYGRNFEQDFTQGMGEVDTGGYHRALRYKLGPLTFVTRLEADAFLDEDGTQIEKVADPYFHGRPTIDASEHEAGISHVSATSIILGGRYVPHSLITELKVAGNKNILGKSMPQLWSGHYGSIATGDHTSGEVEPVKEPTTLHTKAVNRQIAQDAAAGKAGGFRTLYNARVTSQVENRDDWENVNQNNLQKLVGFFQNLLEVMDQVDGGKALLSRTGNNRSLDLYQGRDNMTDALPQEIVSVFWNQQA